MTTTNQQKPHTKNPLLASYSVSIFVISMVKLLLLWR